jgi:hypothetical protein
MAIIKQTILPTGYSAEYARIRRIEVVYELYKDEAARRSGAAPVLVEKVEWFNERNEDGTHPCESIVEIGYSILKEASIFADAEDQI